MRRVHGQMFRRRGSMLPVLTLQGQRMPSAVSPRCPGGPGARSPWSRTTPSSLPGKSHERATVAARIRNRKPYRFVGAICLQQLRARAMSALGAGCGRTVLEPGRSARPVPAAERSLERYTAAVGRTSQAASVWSGTTEHVLPGAPSYRRFTFLQRPPTTLLGDTGTDDCAAKPGEAYRKAVGIAQGREVNTRPDRRAGQAVVPYHTRAPR